MKPKKKDMSIGARIERLRPIFGDQTPKLLKTTDLLLKHKYGKRKGESELDYLTRINYCQECHIPFGFWGFFYVVEGKVSKYVEYKKIEFERQFPFFRIDVLVSTPTLCKINGYATPQSNPIPVQYTIEKAKALRYYNPKSVHWTDNSAKMLNKCAKGDFYDLASGGTSYENLVEGSE